MMQFQRFGSLDPVILLPSLRRPVASRREKPVQHCQENSPFHIELVLASFERRPKYLPDAALLPEPPKDQFGADLAQSYRLGLTRSVSVNDSDLLAVTQPRSHKPIKLAAGLKNIQSSERGNDLLAHLAINAHTAGNLQVPILTGWFDAEKHREFGGLHASNQKIPLPVK